MKGLKVMLNTKSNPNLFGGNIEQYTKENPYVLREKIADGYVVLTKYPASIKSGCTYTLQLKSDGILSNSTVGKYNTHKDFVVYVTDSMIRYYIRLDLSKQTRVLADGTHVFTFEWNKPDVVAYLRVGTFSDGVVENVIKFWDIKIEEGSQQTDIER